MTHISYMGQQHQQAFGKSKENIPPCLASIPLFNEDLLWVKSPKAIGESQNIIVCESW